MQGLLVAVAREANVHPDGAVHQQWPDWVGREV